MARGRKPRERIPHSQIKSETFYDKTDENGVRTIKFRIEGTGTCTMTIPNVSEEERQEGFNNFLDAAWRMLHPGEPVPDKIGLIIDC